MATQGNAALLQSLPNISVPVNIVVVKTAWNAVITDELAAGAERILTQAGLSASATYVVPGAVEIPHLIATLHRTEHAADAYLAFACVIRGDTPHFDYVCQSITLGITLLNVQLSAPVVYGVLTVEHEQQALDRIGGSHGHKGEEAALTALQMLALKDSIGALSR
jgi:6,7-dimethyl-8-ribityllumazine synthase